MRVMCVYGGLDRRPGVLKALEALLLDQASGKAMYVKEFEFLSVP